MRGLGFAILCLTAVLQDLRLGGPFPERDLLFLVAANIAFAGVSWLAPNDTGAETFSRPRGPSWSRTEPTSASKSSSSTRARSR